MLKNSFCPPTYFIEIGYTNSDDFSFKNLETNV